MKCKHHNTKLSVLDCFPSSSTLKYLLFCNDITLVVMNAETYSWVDQNLKNWFSRNSQLFADVHFIFKIKISKNIGKLTNKFLKCGITNGDQAIRRFLLWRTFRLFAKIVFTCEVKSKFGKEFKFTKKWPKYGLSRPVVANLWPPG